MMELAAWASMVVLALATALLLATAHRRSRRSRYKLPPGPTPWPVIGNLNLLGSLPHRSLRSLSTRYGPLLSLRFGSFPVVVGSSVDMARFFLQTKDSSFIDRPSTAAGRYTFYNSSNVLWLPYGAYWRQGRKLYQSELLSAKQLVFHEHVRAEEVVSMLRGLRSAAASSEASATGRRTVALRDHLFLVTLSVISRMVLGRKYVGEEGSSGSSVTFTTPSEFHWMVDELLFLNGTICIGDVIPWIGWLDPQGYVGRMRRLNKMLDRFLEHVLGEHDERRRREGDAFRPKDMVDILLQLADDPNLKIPIQRDGIKAFVLDLIAAGTDTSSVTIEWAMSEVLRSPRVLSMAAEELDRVVGRDRLVAEGDIPNLPFVQAVVKETMRLHPIAPLLTPRLSMEDTSVGGYDIPAGTQVFVNVWAIGRDPAVWDSPEDFRPERFLGSDMDVKGQHYELLPFGSGRRMCPGQNLGLRMVQLTVASLLHAFAWRLPDGMAVEQLSMEEKATISSPRMVPLEAVAESRLPAHLYN